MIVFAYAYKKPVKAEATAATVAVAGAVVVALIGAALGVQAGYATVSNDKYQQFCNDIYNDVKDAVAVPVEAVRTAAGYVVHASQELVAKVGEQIMEKIMQSQKASPLQLAYPNGYYFVNGTIDASFLESLYPSVPDVASHVGSWVNFKYDSLLLLGSIPLKSSIDKIVLPSGTIMTDFRVQTTGDPLHRCTNSGWNQIVWYFQNDPIYKTRTYFSVNDVYGYQFPQVDYSLNLAIVNYTSNGDKSARYLLIYPYGYYDTPTMYSPVDFSAYIAGLPYSAYKAEGKSIINNPVGDVVGTLKDRVGVVGEDGSVSIPLIGTGAADQVDDKTRAQTQAQTVGQDIATAADQDADTAANKDADASGPRTADLPNLDIPGIITRKFPFSIPWDLYRAVTVLQSPGEAPKWSVPVKNQQLGLNYTLTIDLSQFDGPAKVLRWGLSLLFLLGLILLTKKLINH